MRPVRPPQSFTGFEQVGVPGDRPFQVGYGLGLSPFLDQQDAPLRGEVDLQRVDLHAGVDCRAGRGQVPAPAVHPGHGHVRRGERGIPLGYKGNLLESPLVVAGLAQQLGEPQAEPDAVRDMVEPPPQGGYGQGIGALAQVSFGELEVHPVAGRVDLGCSMESRGGQLPALPAGGEQAAEELQPGRGGRCLLGLFQDGGGGIVTPQGREGPRQTDPGIGVSRIEADRLPELLLGAAVVAVAAQGLRQPEAGVPVARVRSGQGPEAQDSPRRQVRFGSSLADVDPRHGERGRHQAAAQGYQVGGRGRRRGRGGRGLPGTACLPVIPGLASACGQQEQGDGQSCDGIHGNRSHRKGREDKRIAVAR